ncbi:MAG: hypothetical protein FJ070_03115 [Cyanobacteria bacterium K_DeepCast_150m_m2_101]|nr:hypothetical protein [Cyanobacteria bacterium K_DeepCast_150m_m2_101]
MASDQAATYIALTSIRGREGALLRTLGSLLRQSLQELEGLVHLHLFLSSDPYLLDRGFARIPAALRRLQRPARPGRMGFAVHLVPNCGPYRKLLPLIQMLPAEQRAADPLLITADDDTLYPPNWLQRLSAAERQWRCVVGFRGRQLMIDAERRILPYGQWLKNDPCLLEPSLRTVPTGKDGIGYRLSYLHASVLDLERAIALAGHADDLWFKRSTLLMGVPSVLLHQSFEQQFPELTGRGRRVGGGVRLEEDSSLFLALNKTGGNDRVMARLDQDLRREHALDLVSLMQEPDAGGGLITRGAWRG